MIIKSYAKINLFLDVTKKYCNGYHSIKSIFSQINLYDTIDYEIIDGVEPQILGCPDIPLQDNLMYKAVKLFQKNIQNVDKTVRLTINKKIPQGGGLGGGSSNAATVLKLLNQVYKTHFSVNQIAKIGAKLGADIPYFITGGYKVVTGFGQIFRPIDSKATLFLLVVLPHIHVDTKLAYKMIDENNLCAKTFDNQKNFRLVRDGLVNNDIKTISKGIYNKFESVIFSKYDKLEEIKKSMLSFGALNAFMSGSGSTMIGLYNSLQDAEYAQKSMNNLGFDSVVTWTR